MADLLFSPLRQTVRLSEMIITEDKDRHGRKISPPGSAVSGRDSNHANIEEIVKKKGKKRGI
jgi:hypothetical protein